VGVGGAGASSYYSAGLYPQELRQPQTEPVVVPVGALAAARELAAKGQTGLCRLLRPISEERA
jgi:hypothetical protein